MDEGARHMIQMTDGRTSNPYSPLFIYCFSALVRTRNRLIKRKESLQISRLEKREQDRADEQTIGRLEALIPSLSLYDRNGVRRQLLLQSCRKGFGSLKEYCDALCSGKEKPDELTENLTYVGSHFFRGGVWPELRESCRAAFADTEKTIRVWCAGSSSGKEAYSVLMLLLDLFPAERIRMLASDYNREMLLRCREGRYPLSTIDEIPGKYRRYTEKYIPAGSEKTDFAYRYQFRFREALRNKIEIRQHNLLSDEYPGGFDLILCRNVIKFFEESARREVQKKLAASLNAGGILVVSDELQSEGIRDPESLQLVQVGDSCIYRNS